MDHQYPTVAKITVLDTGKFEQWQFRIQQYLQHDHYALCEVIESEILIKFLQILIQIIPLQEKMMSSLEELDAYVDVTLKDVADIAKEVALDAEIEESADDVKVEPTKLQEVVKVVTTAKHITDVVTASSATITAATTPLTAAAITTAPSAGRRRK
uniref:Uncharacterized protein n=1 Tax=Tanacetum cinerariifolium TaxID=118510 RepID=A0A699KTP6_TANCI|nr:hypothetical protein [Tanacetum cinerariifolium]